MKEKHFYRLVNSIVTKAFILILFWLILLMGIFFFSINLDIGWLIVVVVVGVFILFIIGCIYYFFGGYHSFIKKILNEHISNDSKDKQLEMLKQINSHLEDLKKDLDSRRNIWL